MVKLKMALAAACALVSFATSSIAQDAEIIIQRGTGVEAECPDGYRQMTFRELAIGTEPS
ncbi:hypothetical protein [Marivivens aquimaris]|uniref:hypothetical protein n=1 Tax=Marivivens aquimaris TaxID=2774876 RepID=UPI00188212C4|nr:hypothetical protein [Marivivens aquimaris]